MNTVRNFLLAAVAFAPALALAHAKLELSVPAADSSIAAMPAQVMLHFSEAVKITAMSIVNDGDKSKVELKVPPEASSMVQAQAPKLGAGVYQLKWSGLSDDGHVTSGTVHFTVTGK